GGRLRQLGVPDRVEIPEAVFLGEEVTRLGLDADRLIHPEDKGVCRVGTLAGRSQRARQDQRRDREVGGLALDLEARGPRDERGSVRGEEAEGATVASGGEDDRALEDLVGARSGLHVGEGRVLPEGRGVGTGLARHDRAELRRRRGSLVAGEEELDGIEALSRNAVETSAPEGAAGFLLLLFQE